MRAQSNTIDPHESLTSPAATVAAGFAMVAALFAVLVALSYPGMVAAFGLGAVSAVVARRGASLLNRASGVCIPGTDVCLRLSRT